MYTYLINILIATSFFLIPLNAASNDENLPKQTLLKNHRVLYHQAPKSVYSFSDMFLNGSLYARIRSNSFLYKWEKENNTQKNYTATGLGGSLIYQSAIFNDFDFRVGGYYSRGFFDVENQDISKLRAANSIMNRFDYVNNGKSDIKVLGQAYINYRGIKDSQLKIGRQLFETFYTKSNDISMIPNTFDALSLSTKLLPKTSIKIGYITKQKTRGQKKSGSVLMYGDTNLSSSINPQWSQNDDNAMHKGLTYTNLKNAGISTDAPLMVIDLKNRSVKNLKIDTSCYMVPNLLSQVMGEANYKFVLNKNFSLSSGFRYIQQFDNGAGEVGGAAISSNTQGYKNQYSLDSKLAAARLSAKYKSVKLQIAYSHVADEADLVSPWRGFLTSGYTFSLTRVNWLANQKSTQLSLNINDNEKGLYKKIYIQFYITDTNADESKGGFDERYYYGGLTQNLPFLQNLQWRLRSGYLSTKRPQASGLDMRFEINYLF